MTQASRTRRDDDIVFEFPLQWPEGWPRTKGADRVSTTAFRVTPGTASIGLMMELKRFGAENVVISSNARVSRVGPRYDDMTRRIEDPGAAVFFTRKGKQFVMARDRYDYIYQNIRSLGLAIEGLRQMERHGGSFMLERAFDGFAALAAPNAHTPWRDVFGHHVATLEEAKLVFRHQARLHHPDAGGTTEMFQRVNQAWEDAQAEFGGRP